MTDNLKLIRLLLQMVAITVVTGCASTTQVVPMPDQSQSVSDVNKARIYVMRPSSIGGANTMTVLDGYERIGDTGGNGYLCWERDPGEVEIRSSGWRISTIKFKCEEGVAYYILQRAENVLELVSEEEGKKWLQQSSRAGVKLK